MRFDYEQTTKIFFGKGRMAELPEIVAGYGKHVLLVTGNRTSSRGQIYQELTEKFKEKGLAVTHYDGVFGNPTTDCVDEGVRAAKESGADVLVGFGGGSVMDSAKAIAVGAVNEGQAWDYLFFKNPQPTKILPVIAVPTTSGTGSQVTQVAVMTETATNTKSAIFNNLLYPKVAVIDPELMESMPSHITASTGFDAFCHCFESYINVKASPYTDMIALEGVKMIAKYLREAVRNGGDTEAREKMAWADTCGGLAIANAGVTLPHGVGMTISGHCPEILHGESLALIYPSFMRFTYPHAIEKFARVGRIFNAELAKVSDEEAAEMCCEEIDKLLQDIGMWINFRQFGVDMDMLKRIAKRSHDLPDYKSNPVIADKEEIFRELKAGYERV